MKRVHFGLIALVLLTAVLIGPVGAWAGVTSGDMVKFTGNIEIGQDDTVNGNVVAMAGNIDIAGRVNGDVTAMAGSIHLRSTAYISGNVVTMAGSIQAEEGATVLGRQTQVGRGGFSIAPRVPVLPPVPDAPPVPGMGGVFPHRGHAWVGNPFARAILWLGWLIGMAAVSALLLTLIPRHFNQMAASLSNEPGRILAAGLIGWVLYPVALLVVALTIIGIPLAILGAVMVPVIVTVGIVVAAIPVGRRVRDMFGGKQTWTGEDRPLLDALIGIVVLMLATAAPMVGWLVWPVSAVVGLGVVLVTRFGTNRPWFPPRRKPETPIFLAGTPAGTPASTPAAIPADSPASANDRAVSDHPEEE